MAGLALATNALHSLGYAEMKRYHGWRPRSGGGRAATLAETRWRRARSWATICCHSGMSCRTASRWPPGVASRAR
eukprot:9338479-Alexandrium_andersonii.AAC.1